jgi:hypothetical protein
MTMPAATEDASYGRRFPIIINFRVTTCEREQIQQMARGHGLNVSEYMRHLLLGTLDCQP